MSKGGDKKVILSVKKLTEFLSSNLLALSKVYVLGGDVRFLELCFLQTTLSKQRNRFIVYLPEKYKLSPGNLKIVYLSESSVHPKISEYLSEMKTDETYTVSITKDYLCLSFPSGDVSMYKISHSPIKNSEDKIEGLQKNIQSIITKASSKNYVSFKDIKDKKVIVPKVQPKEEIVFVDDQGDEVDTFEEEESEEEVEEEKIVEAPDMVIPLRSLGVIYYCIDITSLYSSVTKEEDLYEFYKDLEMKEDDSRNNKLIDIEDLATKLIDSTKEKINSMRKKEEEFIIQKEKLLNVLDQTEELKQKMDKSKNKKKYKEIKDDLQIVLDQTHSTIREIEEEIYKLKDNMDDLLDIVYSSLEEVLEL